MERAGLPEQAPGAVTAQAEAGSLPAIERCALCGSTTLVTEHDSHDLGVTVCPACDHRQAVHQTVPVAEDYHHHTPQDQAFLASLEVTRRRQARVILARLAALDPPVGCWMEFGSGRGWFLEEARVAGVAPLAGFDTSGLATRWLRERDFGVAEPRGDQVTWPDWSTLPFPPRVVSALDVLEHLPGPSVSEAVLRLLTELPTLRWLVVKVPVSDGVMYQTARALRRIYPGPYRQMYQVGTSPPHHHYFSLRSLRIMLEGAGLELSDVWTDSDVDNLFHRIPGLARLPGGALAARAVQLFPADSAIVIARRRRPAASSS